jgi:alpha-beta hydrolase superfamily lysophospholipase
MGTITAVTAARLSPQNTLEISERAGQAARGGHGPAQRNCQEENPEKPFILLAHSIGSFAAQQCVLDHSYSIDGLALSGSDALDGLVRVVS